MGDEDDAPEDDKPEALPLRDESRSVKHNEPFRKSGDRDKRDRDSRDDD